MRRAVSPVIGVVLLVALTVVASAAVGLAVPDLADPPPRAALSLSVDGDEVTLTHEAGDPLAVADLRVVVSVGGARLAHQPPVPFFAATGFEPGPTGPFNSASEGPWTAGERATLELAGTNAPLPEPGETVRVRVYADGREVADLRDAA